MPYNTPVTHKRGINIDCFNRSFRVKFLSSANFIPSPSYLLEHMIRQPQKSMSYLFLNILFHCTIEKNLYMDFSPDEKVSRQQMVALRTHESEGCLAQQNDGSRDVKRLLMVPFPVVFQTCRRSLVE
ncbi:hypothetical protein CRM22_009036 [Opisthorchis felineus]|uniref:Uncharacterized protein n=1 Tax=Opisthorchis felineus TaxID=147828 RepID=A0A4S2L982_OPIFE|nr:hypothetical protein CRM22_009036 [Opisthorchis felineus]